VSVVPVAISGQELPGHPGVVLAGFGAVRLNDAGDVVFWSELGGNAAPETDGAIVGVHTGELGVRLIEGQEADWYLLPAHFAGVPDPRLADDGSIALVASVDQLGIPDPRNEARNTGAFLMSDAGEAIAILRKGEEAPGLSPYLLRNPGKVALASSGRVALRTTTWSAYEEPGPAALYRFTDESLELIATTGQSARTGGQHILGDSFDHPTINNAGTVAFRAALESERFPERDYAIVLVASGDPAAVVATGDPAPGIPGATFDALGIAPALNDAGDIAFFSTLAGVDSPRDTAIWLLRDGTLRLIALEGDSAPGTPGAFSRLDVEPRLNARGQIAFHGHVDLGDGTSATGIWISDGGTPRPVAIEGDPVFAAPGVRLAQIGHPALDERGRVTFTARLSGDPVTVDDDFALFVSDELGRVDMLVRTGTEIDVAGDGSDPRTIEQIIFDSEAAGAQSINAGRQAGIVLRFTDDSSGIFLINAAAPADLDGDADTDSDDFFLFLERFAAGDPDGDFDRDGDHDAEDFFAFLDAFTIL